jgi:hypothetical protein
MPIEGPPSWSSRDCWPSYGPSCRGVQVVAPNPPALISAKSQDWRAQSWDRSGTGSSEHGSGGSGGVPKRPPPPPSYANDDAALRPAGARSASHDVGFSTISEL